MTQAIDIIDQRISRAMAEVSGIEDCPAIVTAATNPKFGDYQANGAMALAKKLKTNPRTLAQQILEKLDISDICHEPEIAGPGFINLRLRQDFINEALLRMHADPQRLNIEPDAQPRPTVVDYSSPNIAKQMHVGHLRSTIIGDAICRMLRFMGHEVIPQNHIGDWGTQFGMLAYYLDYLQEHPDEAAAINADISTAGINIPDMEKFYRRAKELFDADEQFAQMSRQYVVKLQSHQKHVLDNWRKICKESLAHISQLYQLLGIELSEKDVKGESFYNDMLAQVVQDLQDQHLAVDSEGAVCVFPEGFVSKDDQPLPFIIRKSDGAYLYATTDLAALRYRVDQLKARRIIYVTDSRQKLHFEMLFHVGRKAGWAPADVELAHVTFGTVLAPDGTPLKTRSGQSVKLRDLLDEAVVRAGQIVEQKNPDLPDELKKQIARAVGIGAVKYADYSNNRTSDYVFSFDRMLAMEGNTAPYMQYAYARIKSIERKAHQAGIDFDAELRDIQHLSFTEPDEIALAKYLIRYSQAIETAIADYRPNFLTNYLYELTQKFSSFYTNCPVIKAEPAARAQRLLLCQLTSAVIKHCLTQLLGIQVVDQM